MKPEVKVEVPEGRLEGILVSSELSRSWIALVLQYETAFLIQENQFQLLGPGGEYIAAQVMDWRCEMFRSLGRILHRHEISQGERYVVEGEKRVRRTISKRY